MTGDQGGRRPWSLVPNALIEDVWPGRSWIRALQDSTLGTGKRTSRYWAHSGRKPMLDQLPRALDVANHHLKKERSGNGKQVDCR